MKKRTWIVGVAAGLALAGIGVFFWNGSSSQKAAAQAPRGDQRVVPVTVAKAVKQSVPVRLEALGTVTTIASVAIKPRVDSEIVAVKFEDGARVKQGDVLFVLDSRSIETEIKRVEAVIAGAEAQFEQASARRRALHRSGGQKRHHGRDAQQRADPGQRLPRARRFQQGHARRASGSSSATAPSARRSPAASAWPTSRSAISSGRPTRRRLRPSTRSRRSTSRSPVPQRSLPDVRAAIAAETASLEAIVPGSDARADRPGHDGREHGRSRHRHGDDPRHHAERARKCCGRARWSTPR